MTAAVIDVIAVQTLEDDRSAAGDVPGVVDAGAAAPPTAPTTPLRLSAGAP